MKQKLIITTFYLLLVFLSKNVAQDYPLAPEVWSQPVRVDSLSNSQRGESCPSLTKNMDTMYLYIADGIYRSVLENGKWKKPTRLSNNVNSGGALRNPSISKDGQRIYYSAWGGYGSWDLWYSDWDSKTNDWGPNRNLGPVLNSQSMDWYIYEISKDSLFILNDRVATPSPILYVFDNIKNDWTIADSYNYHKLGCCSVQGINMSANKKKIYYSDINFSWSDNNYKKRYSELCVVYWDSVKNYWSEPYFLNINANAFQPDTTNPFDWIGGTDEFPWISPDGKVLYFHSNRDSAREDTLSFPDIYVSYLLIDENGNPVSVKSDHANIPNGYKLFQNYPNPFNPITKIRYTIPETTFLTLTVYDIRGRKITELENEIKQSGEYEVEFDARKYNLSSGIYIYQLRSRYAVLTNKFTLIK